MGIIKLGMKDQRGLPKALDYFLCPGEVQEVYGEKPTKLDIRFAYNYLDDIFPQFYKLYGSSAGLKAYSDGVKLWTKGDQPGKWIESKAPSKEELEKAGFRSTATLVFVLPKVSLAGAYHISTHSFHSIVKLNSSIDYIKHLFGRIQGLPLQLILEGKEAHITINGKPAKKTVYTMRLHFEEAEIMEFVKRRKVALEKMVEEPVALEAPHAELPAPVEPVAHAGAEVPADDEDDDGGEPSDFEKGLQAEAAAIGTADAPLPEDSAADGAAQFDAAVNGEDNAQPLPIAKTPPLKPTTAGGKRMKEAWDQTKEH